MDLTGPPVVSAAASSAHPPRPTRPRGHVPAKTPPSGVELDPEWALGMRLYPDYVTVFDDTLSPDDPEYYPCRPELAIVEGEIHELIIDHSRTVLVDTCPGRAVFARLAVYWKRGNRNLTISPDVMVTERHPDRKFCTSYVAFMDPPILFVMEVVSPSNTGPQLDHKSEIYRKILKVPEYLLVDPQRDTLVLYRLRRHRYQPVRPDAAGRVWSAECRVWFVWEPEEGLRIYGEDGVLRLPYVEERARAERERLRAETATILAAEERRRAEAEHLRAEAAGILAAEARARAERLAARLRELGLNPDE